MKLRTLRRYCQTQLESSWMRIRSRFVDVEKLKQLVNTNLRIGVVVLDGGAAEQTCLTVESVESQVYPSYSLAKSDWTSAAATIQEQAQEHDFVAILDPGIVLEPDALFWAVIAIHRSSTHPDWIYFDHLEPIRDTELAVVEKSGSRHPAYRTDNEHSGQAAGRRAIYKPEFSPEYLLSGAFTGGFNLFSSTAIHEIAMTSFNADCLQYEMAFRLLESKSTPNVLHVPQITYTATSIPTETELESQRLVIQQHLNRRGVTATVECTCRQPVVFSPVFGSRNSNEVTVLIPTRNQVERVRKCVEDVRATTGENVRIRMIDNQSDDERLFAFYQEQQRIGRFDVESFNEPFNYARMHNLAIDKIDTEYVLLLNNDVFEFSTDWVDQLIGTASLSPDIGCVGALLRYPDGMTQHGGVSFGIGRPCRHIHLGIPANAPGYCGRLQAIQQLSALTAALLLVRRDVYCELGGFDENRYPISYNDTDLCLKMRDAGYRSIYNPRVTAIHEESVSRGRSPLEKKWRNTFIEQWAGKIECDPFYNPHLSKREYAVDDAAFRAWQQRKTVSLEAAVRAA